MSLIYFRTERSIVTKGYEYEDYLHDYRKFRDALRKNIPGAHLAGPDVGDRDLMGFEICAG